MVHRPATAADALLLAALNRELAEDEQHRNATRSLEWFEDRMRGWLATGWKATIFSDEAGAPLAYALWREQEDSVYLRQFFVRRDRRRQGLGRQAFELLRSALPPGRRLTVEALTQNPGAISFWRAVGFSDYAVTLELQPSAEAASARDLPDPDPALAKRMFEKVRPEQRLCLSHQGRNGPVTINVSTLWEILGYLQLPRPALDYGMIAGWIDEAVGDATLAGAVRRLASEPDPARALEDLKYLIGLRLRQCREKMG